MTQKYFAIPTAAGEAAIANAQLTGKALKYTHMSVGDGGGDNAPVPTPNRDQKTLIGERHRVQINRLFRDPTNSALLIIEAVLPSDIGGWWIRELAIWDEANQLAIIANCAPSFKPLLSEGAARDQVLRIALVVSGQVPIELKIDPAVVLATRGYVDDGLDKKLDKTAPAVAAAKLTTARTISVTGDLTGSVSFDGTKNVSFVGILAATGVTAGVYGSANAVAVVTVDAKGRVTKVESTSIGNAQTATKLAAARSFSISGGATAAAANFDGSGNVQLVVTGLDVSKATLGILPVARGGTGLGTVAAGSYLTGAGTNAFAPRTPEQVLEDIQAFPRAGGAISGPVTLAAGSALGSLYGTNDTSGRTAHVLLPDGGSYSTHIASVVGAMKIKLPPIAVGRNSMIRMRVDIFEYLADTPPVSVLIHGYAQTGKTWARCGATIVGGIANSDLPVRFGSDSAGDICIWLGDVTRSWQYPTVSVSEVHAKYNTPGATVETWGTGWKVEPVTAFETVSVTLASGNLAFARADLSSVSGLSEALALKADAARQIIAGNGMSGGGTLAANRTLTLGTPSTITKDSTNTVSTTSHSHQLDVTAADIGAASAASSIVAGNGMTGGGTLSTSRTLTLGTPGTLSATSSNSVQATSHTHALDTQTGPNDATPGRILTVGNAFGLGADNPLNTEDLNTVTVPGDYGQRMNANATAARNYPTNKAGTLRVGSAGPQITTHKYVVYDTGEYYTRGCYNNVWSEWNYHPGLSRFPTATEARQGTARLATTAQAAAMADDATVITPKKLGDALKAVTGQQVYITPGTFTWVKPTGVTKVRVRVIGGGGGGASDNVAPGPSGGGQGGYWEGIFDVSGMASVPITVGAGGAGATVTGTNGGAGGTSSFGTMCSATGGAGGTRDANSSSGGTSNGGAGFGWDGGAGSVCVRDVYGSGFLGGAGGGFTSPFGVVDSSRRTNPGVGGGGRVNSAGAPGAHGAVIIEW
ncbi:phage tail-collar fiber domain-containing protein [Achromobacter insolitus]|uniref:phage tail-collar fiber domain-containing protein n=1 Tax=Achromobacter insolitus TaxID=217204 RepID=UPI0028A7C312|nr:phage tail protein [Achromobacter insolitus]